MSARGAVFLVGGGEAVTEGLRRDRAVGGWGKGRLRDGKGVFLRQLDRRFDGPQARQAVLEGHRLTEFHLRISPMPQKGALSVPEPPLAPPTVLRQPFWHGRYSLEINVY